MYTSNLYQFTHMHSFISHYRIAKFGKVVFVACDFTLLSMNIYDENAKKKKVQCVERIHSL